MFISFLRFWAEPTPTKPKDKSLNGSQELVSGFKKRKLKKKKKIQADDDYCIDTIHLPEETCPIQFTASVEMGKLCGFRNCDAFCRRQCHRPKQFQ